MVKSKKIGAFYVTRQRRSWRAVFVASTLAGIVFLVMVWSLLCGQRVAAPASSDGVSIAEPTHRQAVDDVDARRETASTCGQLSIRGRCVSSVNGVVVGVSVELLQRQAPKAVYEVTPNETILNSNRSGIDGRFEVAGDGSRPARAEIRFTCRGFVLKVVDLGASCWGKEFDLGDVLLEQGCVIGGRVLDAVEGAVSGEPVVFARLNNDVSGAADRAATDTSGEDSITYYGITGTDGAFRCGPLPAGEWGVTVGERRRVIKNGRVIVDREDELRVEIWVEPAVDWVFGYVLDEGGVGINGARVGATLADGKPTTLVTGEGGVFEMPRYGYEPDGPVTLWAEMPGYERSRPQSAAWGARNVVFTLRRSVSVLISVTEAGSGKAVEEYGIRLIRRPSEGPSPLRARLPRKTGFHAGGVCRLGDVTRGAWLIGVEPLKKHLGPSALQEISVERDDQRIDIVVESLIDRKVVVKDGEGAKVSGSHVVVMRSLMGGKLTENTTIVRRPLLQGFGEGGALAEDEGDTDENGMCRLRCTSGGRVAIRVTGDKHAPMLVENVDWGGARDGSEEICIQVVRGGSIVGIISPVSAIGECKPRVHLRRAKDSSVSYPGRVEERVPVSADGSFIVQNIPSGDWRVCVTASSWTYEEKALVRNLVAGETRRVFVWIGEVASGEVKGSVSVGGAEFRGLVVLVPENQEAWGPLSQRCYRSFIVKGPGEGKYKIDARPGRYRAIGLQNVGGRIRRLLSSVRVDVGPASQQRVDLDFEDRSKTFRISRPDSRIAGEKVKVRVLWSAEGDPVGTLVPDPEGRFTIDSLPPPGFVVEVTEGAEDSGGERKRHLFGPFAEIEKQTEVLLRLL